MPDADDSTSCSGSGPSGPGAFSPPSVLAWSEARVDDREPRRPHMLLWRPAGVNVAIGIGQKPDVELELDAMLRDGVGLVRRQSGGGAVLLYPGVLCWEAWAGLEEIEAMTGGDSGIRASYAALCGPVTRALCGMGIEAFHAGICDISCRLSAWERPRKMAGTAQLRRRDMVLVHGSLLVNPDLDVLARYLKFPSEQPEYRQNRPHRDFCVSVAELVPRIEMENAVAAVAADIATEAERSGWEMATMPAALDSAAAGLLEEKYLSDAWNREKMRRR